MKARDGPMAAGPRSLPDRERRADGHGDALPSGRKVLIMSKKDPRLSGGVESVVMGILSALRGTRHRVTLMFFGDAGREELMAETRQYRATGTTTMDALIYGIIAGAEAYACEYDLANVHGEVGFMYGALNRARRRCGRLIATSHGVSWYALGSYATLLPWRRRMLMAIYRPLVTLAEGVTFRSADVVIAVSSGVAEEVVRLYGVDPKKIRIIHNRVDTGPFRPRPREEAIERLGLDRGRRYLLYVGREHLRKNLKMAVTTLAELRARGIEYDLLVVGLSPEQLPVAAQGEHVRALGKVPSGDLPYVYNASDALLHPSLYEGHPITPLEALASGTPVVASAASKVEIPPAPFIRIVKNDRVEDYVQAVIEVISLHADPVLISQSCSCLGSASYEGYVRLFDGEEAGTSISHEDDIVRNSCANSS